jgi:uncharacterized protein (TIGR02301 family)
MVARTATAGRPAALPALLAAVGGIVFAGELHAQASGSTEARPYDDRLMRLSEVLGAVHFLRELCGNNDGMLWRDRMQELINAEGVTPTRRLRLTRAFNTGYRSYSRTYATCTPSAQTAIARFLAEGSEIADTLVKTTP